MDLGFQSLLAIELASELANRVRILVLAGVLTAMASPSYRFGFNGQEKDDEMSGEGNTNTAEYWEYDARLGRRWNIDPKPNSLISLYGL